ncbi:MAG: DNA translocase FtsK 4TM domain-containing protein, partial [Selenomonas sp.]|nr:DNA translocase FtsK 4TM domain-containing protein [Selenomonas sp.]
MKKKTPAKKPAARATKAQRQAARRKPAPAAPGRRYELIGLLFFAVGLISACGLAGLNVGFVGLTFAKCLHYLFGVGAALVVLLILLIGWQYMTKHRGLRYSLRFFGLTALFALALAAYHHFVTVPGAEILPESLPRGGGLIGGGLLLLIRRFFGVDGAIIVMGVGLVGAVLLSTTWSLASGLLKTEETAKRGAQAAGKAVAVTCDKVAEVGERAGGQVVEKVRAKAQSFYNQAADHRFSEPPVAEQAADEGANQAAPALQDPPASQAMAWETEPEREASVEPPAATAPEPPRFTVDYGARGAEEPALTPEDMTAEEAEGDEDEAARAGLAALAAAGVAGAAEAAAAVPAAAAAGAGSAAAASA